MLKSSEYCLSQTMAYPSGKLNGALPRQEHLHHHRARQLAGEATRNLECPVSSFPVPVVFHQKVCDRPYVFILSLFHPVPPTMPLAQLTSLRAGRLCTIELRDPTSYRYPAPTDALFKIRHLPRTRTGRFNGTRLSAAPASTPKTSCRRPHCTREHPSLPCRHPDW